MLKGFTILKTLITIETESISELVLLILLKTLPTLTLLVKKSYTQGLISRVWAEQTIGISQTYTIYLAPQDSDMACIVFNLISATFPLLIIS